MNSRKIRFETKWLVAILMIIGLTLGLGQRVSAAEFGLGDIPLDEETYQKDLLIYPYEAIPASYDARVDGIVTPPKNQGACGSCWSFASTGAFESHLLKEFGFGPTDLSEQQQVSCNLSMLGCCGGSSTSLQWWETQGPIYESCFSYAEGYTSCPTQRTVSCSAASGCEELYYRVTNWHTVSPTPTQFNTSLYNDGPSYWRFDVYSDFMTFWNSGSPGQVYTNVSGVKEGGHAVLLIGWDDSKNAYLCKNSWGATGGPNGDGTFWIAYSGHAYDLNFQMANFDLTSVEPQFSISPPSGDYVSTQAFDLILIVEAPGFSLVGGSATLDGYDVTAALASCLIPGTLIPGGQTFRCPSLTGGLFGTGTHTLGVTLDLSDGSSVSDTVTWEVKQNTEP